MSKKLYFGGVIMLVYEEAWDYNGYLDSDLLEYKEKQEEIFSKIELDKKSIKKIKGIKSIVNLVIFAEIYCPDSRALIPFIEKIRVLNNHINISIFPRKGNEAFMEHYSNTPKIPTILMEDLKKGDENFVMIFEEFPEVTKVEIESKTDEADKIKLIYDYRTGRRNSEIESILIEGILKTLE